MILGVSFDTPADNLAFQQKYGFAFDLLTDADRRMAIAYGAAQDAGASHPGRAACVIAPDGTVHRWWAGVDARAFPESVLQELPECR